MKASTPSRLTMSFHKVRARARRVVANLRADALILLYHRVAELRSDPQLLSVSPSHFAQQLDVIQRHCRPVALRELVRGVKDGGLRRRSVAITFDDGYTDNVLNAAPRLKRRGIPATFFVTSGQLDSGRGFWWDELERILLSSRSLPDSLRITMDGRAREWQTGGGAGQENWHVLSTMDPSPLQKAYKNLQELLYEADARTRENAMAQLSAWAGTERAVRDDYRALSSQELGQLATNDLFEVGAHTDSHSRLSSLPLFEQKAEVLAGKQKLESILERPISSFSYPFGGRADYTPETVAVVREAGFDCACSNFQGHVRKGTDKYQLPRYIVRDWDGPEFARRLKEWWRG